MIAVGQTTYPPTEAQWEELEAEIEAIESRVPISIKERLGSASQARDLRVETTHGFLIGDQGSTPGLLFLTP